MDFDLDLSNISLLNRGGSISLLNHCDIRDVGVIDFAIFSSCSSSDFLSSDISGVDDSCYSIIEEGCTMISLNIDLYCSSISCDIIFSS